MAILTGATKSGKLEIFKFRETGLEALFQEVLDFRKFEKETYGRNWKPVDIRSDEDSFYVIMEEL